MLLGARRHQQLLSLYSYLWSHILARITLYENPYNPTVFEIMTVMEGVSSVTVIECTLLQ